MSKQVTPKKPRHTIVEENAHAIWGWFQERGGICVWNSVDLSDPSASWTTPKRNEAGRACEKPHWKAADFPELTIDDPAEVLVVIPKEVKRFRVAVRRSSQGFCWKVSDYGSKRIKKALNDFGDDAWYNFDYMTQEAVIYVPGSRVSLLEYMTTMKENK